MRVTNIIREKISRTVDKQVDTAISALYADHNALEASINEQLAAIRAEANAKAAKILAQCPEAYFSCYGQKAEFITNTAYVNLPKDAELSAKATAIYEKAKEIKMDMEIRCQLEKNADAFFKALGEVKL